MNFKPKELVEDGDGVRRIRRGPYCTTCDKSRLCDKCFLHLQDHKGPGYPTWCGKCEKAVAHACSLCNRRICEACTTRHACCGAVTCLTCGRTCGDCGQANCGQGDYCCKVCRCCSKIRCVKCHAKHKRRPAPEPFAQPGPALEPENDEIA